MILEHNGVRFRIKEKQLSQHQTEQDDGGRIARLRREFAEHPSAGLTPPRLAAILNDAEQGNLIQQCWLADDIEEKDGHIAAELFKRKMALSSVDFTVEPPRQASEQEKKDAANIEDILRDTEDWDDLLFNLADGITKGFSNIEFAWQRYQGFYVPHAFEHRPASWFQLAQHNQNELRLRDHTGLGEPLRPLNWLQHRHTAKSGYVARTGLVRQLAWPFIFKNYSVRDLAEFLEIYGIPIRLGKYPSGATDNEKNRLLQAVLSVGHNGAGIIPKGMDLEFHEAAKGGGEPFMTMVNWCERIQSKVILGQTLSAQVDSTGSQALGTVHDGIRLDIRDHDLRQVAGTLNRDLIQPMYLLNGKSYTGDPRRKPRLVFDVSEPESLSLYAESLPKLVDVGMQIPVSYAHDKLQIPMPDGKEPVLGRIMPGLAPLKGHAALRASSQTQGQDQQAIEQALDKLSTGELEPDMVPLLQPIMQLAEQDPDALTEQLPVLFPNLDDSALEERLARILFVAELWGMSNA